LADFADCHRNDAADTSVLDQAGSGQAGSGQAGSGSASSVDAAKTTRSRMLETLGILDAATTLLSAPRLTVDARAAAHRLQHAAAACATAANPREFADLSYSFHRTLVSCCPNQRMLGLLAEEITLVRALLDDDRGPRPEELCQAAREHALLLEVVETAPNSPDIISLLREHRQICY
jgi:DNA-binding GntR family transcriptional regulator